MFAIYFFVFCYYFDCCFFIFFSFDEGVGSLIFFFLKRGGEGREGEGREGRREKGGLSQQKRVLNGRINNIKEYFKLLFL